LYVTVVWLHILVVIGFAMAQKECLLERGSNDIVTN